MRAVRRILLALVTSAALLTATTGCGGGGGGDGAGDGKPKPSAAREDGASAEARPDSDSSANNGKEPRAVASGTRYDSGAAKVPKAELTPATGSFTRTQKKYLEGRVPKGVDPAAILVSGEEICERVARTEEADRKAVIDAIGTGEIAGARAAITHLCPEHKDLLAAASG